MATSTFNLWPNQLVIGAGASKELSSHVRGANGSRVMVFTDRGIKDLPMVKDLVDRLREDDLPVSLFGEIGPNPTDTMVHEAVSVMNDFKPDIIVCIGGGSPMDTAKAANVVYTHGGKVGEYDVVVGGIEKISPKILPLIAIPTTSGTGSEVSLVGVITDTEKHLKYGVLSPLLIPNISILDPELTVSLPKTTTAYTGMDALTHLIEAYCSRVDFPITDGVSTQGMKMINGAIRTAVEQGDNLQAREDMLVASMMGGMAFTVNGLGLCHQMAHQLSAYFDVPHGLANAVLLPHVMRFNMPANLQKFADIAEALGADVRRMSLEEAAEKSIELVEVLSGDVGIPKYLDDIGVTKDKVKAMVKTALADPVGMNNLKETTPEECGRVYLNAFKA
jgi:alcohol dehydrogenase class IV